MPEQEILFKRPFVMVYHMTGKLTGRGWVSRLDEDSPEIFDGDFTSMREYMWKKFPHATFKDYNAPHYGKESRWSMPKFTKKALDEHLMSTWVGRDEKIKQLLND